MQLPTPDFPKVADPKKRAYVVAFALTHNLREAAAAAGVDLKTGYNWRHDESDTDFKEAFGLAQAMAADAMEAEIRRRAMDGVDEPVYQMGFRVGTIRKYSDTLLIFMAKAAMPQKYRERFEHTGPNGGPIRVRPDMSKLSEDELVALRGLLTKATPGTPS